MLTVSTSDRRFTIEMTPVPKGNPADGGVVATGPAGARRAERVRIFRYDVPRWRDGVIPDLAEAVDSPRRVSSPERAQRVLALASSLPTPVWGRDELGAGEGCSAAILPRQSSTATAWTGAQTWGQPGSCVCAFFSYSVFFGLATLNPSLPRPIWASSPAPIVMNTS